MEQGFGDCRELVREDRVGKRDREGVEGREVAGGERREVSSSLIVLEVEKDGMLSSRCD